VIDRLQRQHRDAKQAVRIGFAVIGEPPVRGPTTTGLKLEQFFATGDAAARLAADPAIRGVFKSNAVNAAQAAAIVANIRSVADRVAGCASPGGVFSAARLQNIVAAAKQNGMSEINAMYLSGAVSTAEVRRFVTEGVLDDAPILSVALDKDPKLCS
jgi:hypothetical protein